ncbi:MAG: hypothetical protein ACYS47_03655 [Planctomycetota bacterium]|jgi:hypothetical protein
MDAYTIMTLVVFGTFTVAAVLFVFLFARKIERPRVLRTVAKREADGRGPRRRVSIVPLPKAPPPREGVPKRDPTPKEEIYNPRPVRMVICLMVAFILVVGFIYVVSTRTFQDLALLVFPVGLFAFLWLFYWLSTRERSTSEWRKWGKAHRAASTPGEKTKGVLGSSDDHFEGRNPPNSWVRAEQLKQKGIYYRIP